MMIRKLLTSLAILCATAYGQVPVSPIVQPHMTFVNGSGGPCAGCSLFSYGAGTTTPLATYTDASGTSQNTNPIILDAAGGAQIWLGAKTTRNHSSGSLPTSSKATPSSATTPKGNPTNPRGPKPTTSSATHRSLATR